MDERTSEAASRATETAPSVTGAGLPRATDGTGATEEAPVTRGQPVHLYVHVVVIAVIGAVATLAWLIAYEVVNRLLWENSFVVANHGSSRSSVCRSRSWSGSS